MEATTYFLFHESQPRITMSTYEYMSCSQSKRKRQKIENTLQSFYLDCPKCGGVLTFKEDDHCHTLLECQNEHCGAKMPLNWAMLVDLVYCFSAKESAPNLVEENDSQSMPSSLVN